MKLFDYANDVKIVCEKAIEEAIRLAVLDLQKNLRGLSKKKHEFPIINETLDSPAIYIQTKPLGEPESYEVCVDDEKVLITGSDVLGTIYGIYAFATQCLHIMPTYRLTDIFPEQREYMELEPQIIKSKERNVRFRGWFINDEDLLSEYKISGGERHIDYPFYKNVMATDVLDMVLETALRLEINLIIPASFLDIDNPDEEVLIKAVCQRGLYISQHHVEPMGVSHFSAENFIQKYGEEGENISFISNRVRMEEIWQYYANKWAVYGKQVVWQLGLRGKADQAVWKADPSVPNSMEMRGQIITDAIQTQYDIVCKTLGTDDFHSTATLWNEGSELFGKGHLKLPQNTIIVFCDFGIDQMLGEDFYTAKCEGDRKCGIYYHTAYWARGPHLTEGCRPEKMAYNYRNAAEQGKLYYSILNVSNVRPFHFSVTMNAKIMENPLGLDVREEMRKFDRAIFGEFAEEVNALRSAYYDCFAAFRESPLKAKMERWSFYYRSYKDISFLRNAATDGQLIWYGKDTLSGNILSDRPDAKEDIPGMKESVEKFKSLYKKMEMLEQKLPQEVVTYFRQFLKYQTHHMQLITEWCVACQELMDDTFSWKERKARGEFACSCLEQLLEERKVLEEGKWENWHHGDKKMNLTMRLEETHKRVLELAHKKEV